MYLFYPYCGSCFHCSQPFCPAFRFSWSFGRTQNKATTRQPCILCGWSGCLEQSTTGHSFGTYIINVQKHAQDTSVVSFLRHWLTVSQSMSSEDRMVPYSDSSLVTAPYKLSFYYYYFLILLPSHTYFGPIIIIRDAGRSPVSKRLEQGNCEDVWSLISLF